MTSGPDHAPLILERPDDCSWDDSADVLVVGFGGAGVVAALQALETGASVLAIDRFGGGGATAYSGGVIYSAGTEYQRQAGFDDTPDEMFKYLQEEGTPVADETLQRFCQDSAEDLQWLERHGVPYGGDAFLQKTAFPPDGHWLYFSGNETTPRFAAIAKPAPRGHRVKTPGNGGPLYHARLRQAAEAGGVRLLPHARATRLILDRSNAVIGVEVAALAEEHWDAHAALYNVVNPWKPFNNRKAERAIIACRAFEEAHARTMRLRGSAVILSTGGFIHNLAMLERQRPQVARSYDGLLRLGSMGCDGSGISLGESVGAETALMDSLFLGSPLSPPISFLTGIIVNQGGERFVAEDAYHARVGNALALQSEDGTGWLLLESRSFWKAMKQALFPGRGMFMTWGAPALLNVTMGGTRRAGSLDKLARKCGIDPAGLRRTVDAYNATVRSGATDPLGKAADKLHVLEEGPFYAVNIAINNRFMPTMAFTLGGLVVDERSGQVQKPDRTPIEGLFAAGRAAVGLCSLGYMSGLSIADTVFSGRRAGKHAGALPRD